MQHPKVKIQTYLATSQVSTEAQTLAVLRNKFLYASVKEVYYLLGQPCFNTFHQLLTFVDTDPDARVRFPGTTKKSSGSGTGSTQPREYN
jgi:hypothetical protein